MLGSESRILDCYKSLNRKIAKRNPASKIIKFLALDGLDSLKILPFFS